MNTCSLVRVLDPPSTWAWRWKHSVAMNRILYQQSFFATPFWTAEFRVFLLNNAHFWPSYYLLVFFSLITLFFHSLQNQLKTYTILLLRNKPFFSHTQIQNTSQHPEPSVIETPNLVKISTNVDMFPLVRRGNMSMKHHWVRPLLPSLCLWSWGVVLCRYWGCFRRVYLTWESRQQARWIEDIFGIMELWKKNTQTLFVGGCVFWGTGALYVCNIEITLSVWAGFGIGMMHWRGGRVYLAID